MEKNFIFYTQNGSSDTICISLCFWSVSKKLNYDYMAYVAMTKYYSDNENSSDLVILLFFVFFETTIKKSCELEWRIKNG